MRRWWVLVLVCSAAAAGLGAGLHARVALPPGEGPAGGIRFVWADVVIDTGGAPLAAYQVELRDRRGVSAIVGIEGSGGDSEDGGGGPPVGGAAAAFSGPPYYDPAALMNDRIIIAALSTLPADSLPSGRTRVARLHLRVAGERDPDWAVTLHAAAGPDAAAIPARVTVITGGRP